MKVWKMLPAEFGDDLEAGAQGWLMEIAPELRRVVTDGDAAGLRRRIELLSSYMPTLGQLAATFQRKADGEARNYKRAYPKPLKNVTEWKEALDDCTRPFRRVVEHLNQTREDILVRISGAQTQLNSIREEQKRGLG